MSPPSGRNRRPHGSAELARKRLTGFAADRVGLAIRAAGPSGSDRCAAHPPGSASSRARDSLPLRSSATSSASMRSACPPMPRPVTMLVGIAIQTSLRALADQHVGIGRAVHLAVHVQVTADRHRRHQSRNRRRRRQHAAERHAAARVRRRGAVRSRCRPRPRTRGAPANRCSAAPRSGTRPSRLRRRDARARDARRSPRPSPASSRRARPTA